MLTDSGDDGKEPPNGNEWRFIERKNINSNIGIPILKTESDKSENSERSETTSVVSEKEKRSSSEEETLDERE